MDSVPAKRSSDPGTYVQIKGACVQIDVADADLNDVQAGRLLSEIVRRAAKIRGIKRANVSLYEGTMNIVPEFGHAARNQVREIMRALIKEIDKIFRRHYARAVRSRQDRKQLAATGSRA